MPFCYYVANFASKALFSLLYHHKTYGKENFIKGPALIAANHTSFLDPPLVAASCSEEIHFLARSSLFSHWFLGKIIATLNTYPVQGGSEDLSSFKLVQKLLGDGHKVVIFPEGVRSYDGNLLPLKHGVAMLALRCQVPIIPVHISGAFEVWSRARRLPKLWGYTSCSFAPPIDVKDFASLPKKKAQEKIVQKLTAALKLIKS